MIVYSSLMKRVRVRVRYNYEYEYQPMDASDVHWTQKDC